MSNNTYAQAGSPDDQEWTPEQAANVAALLISGGEVLERTQADEAIPVLNYYCWNSDHQGGWSCRECWTEVQATGEQNNA